MRTYLLFLGFFCLLTVGLVTVWHQVDTLRVGYDVSRLRRREEDLHRDCNRLTVSITGLKSPPMVEGLAQHHRLPLMRPLRVVPATTGIQALRSDEDGRDILDAEDAARPHTNPEEISRVASPSPGGHPETVRSVGWVSIRGLSGRR